jgi:acyl-coenzyme A thioesterase PaaI-like protein
MTAQEIPPGFEPWPSRNGQDFLAHNGPLYRRVEDGFTLGFRVLPQHCNPGGTCHGGMLSFLADMLLIGGSKAALGYADFTTTISLHSDFLEAVPVGSWLEGRMQVSRATGSLIFSEGRLTCDGRPVLRVSGILRRPTPR